MTFAGAAFSGTVATFFTAPISPTCSTTLGNRDCTVIPVITSPTVFFRKGAVDIAAIYDRAFFEAHVPWQSEYSLIADLLAARLPFASALDLGCGNGFLIARLLTLGKTCDGVDGSPHAVALAAPEAAPRIQVMDLRAPLSLGRRDLVICSEVAEHLEARYADALVDNICSHCG